MTVLLWNIVLAFVWAAMTGDVDATNLLLGFAIGMAILLTTRLVVGAPQYAIKAAQIAGLLLFVLWELLLSNIQVARVVLRPNARIHPGIIAIPLDAETDGEITILATLLTLTPGSTALDVSEDRKWLLVHDIDVDASRLVEEKARIKNSFERRVLEVWR